MRKIKNAKIGDFVVYVAPTIYYQGIVIAINAKNKTIDISWTEGSSSYIGSITYSIESEYSITNHFVFTDDERELLMMKLKGKCSV